MSLNDPLAGVLSDIMNHQRVAKKELVTKFNSTLIRTVLGVLQQQGYIGSLEELPDGKNNILKINLLGNINKIGAIKPRFPVTRETAVKFEKRFLPAKDFGIIIISTNQGIMTLQQAKEKQLGGRLLCYCY